MYLKKANKPFEKIICINFEHKDPPIKECYDCNGLNKSCIYYEKKSNGEKND